MAVRGGRVVDWPGVPPLCRERARLLGDPGIDRLLACRKPHHPDDLAVTNRSERRVVRHFELDATRAPTRSCRRDRDHVTVAGVDPDGFEGSVRRHPFAYVAQSQLEPFAAVAGTRHSGGSQPSEIAG